MRGDENYLVLPGWTLAQLKAKALLRPPGYEDDMLSCAVEVEPGLFAHRKLDFFRLLEKYARTRGATLTPEQHAAAQAAREAAEAAERAKYRYTPPGRRWHDLFAALGITPTSGCSCSANAATMDGWWLAIEQELPDADYPALMALFMERHLDAVAGFLRDGGKDQTGIAVPLMVIRPAVRALMGKWAREGP